MAGALQGMGGQGISQPVAALFGRKRQNCRHWPRIHQTDCKDGDHHTNTKTNSDTKTNTNTMTNSIAQKTKL